MGNIDSFACVSFFVCDVFLVTAAHADVTIRKTLIQGDATHVPTMLLCPC